MPEPSPPSCRPRSLARHFSAHAVLNAFFFLGGLGIVATGLKLGVGTCLEPGAGLWPAMLGVGLALCGLSLRRKKAEASVSPKADRRALLGMTLACCLWIGLLLPLGWLAATLLAVGAACWGARARLAETVLLMILLAGGLYFGVEKLLNWPLPGGLFATLPTILTGGA